MKNHTGDCSHDLPKSADILAKQIRKMRFADAIDTVNKLDIDQAVLVLKRLPIHFSIELFDRPELQKSAKLIEFLPTKHAISILNGMSADEAADVFQEIDERTRQRLFSQLQPTTRAELKKLTSYPEDSAGALMTTEFIAVPSTWTIETTLNHIREVEETRETVYTVYILNPISNQLLSAISLRRLILAKSDENILDAAQHMKPISITASTDHEEVARLFRRHDLLSVPVIDKDNRVIGIVTVDDVFDAMTEEMSEDTHKFGGVGAIDKPYMQISFFEMLKKRGGWLCLLFMGEMFTASAMQYFEKELEKAIVLTLFIPLIMSSGGNSGSQATSLIIRALALRELKLGDWWKIIRRELSTGLSLGSMLGLIGFSRIILWQNIGIYNYGEHWFLIALTIFCTLVSIVTFGSLIGSMLPFILKAMRFDPASASAPFVATFVDVTGIVIYFSIAAIILAGTLL
ncbi:MAG: magnesium transporter [Candidatus Tokpelaia sp. JSC161]|jgi:magnesium transporter|nr:MAG: magnesium transporter [Candidatus Tokpelaia sp. JSC161]